MAVNITKKAQIQQKRDEAKQLREQKKAQREQILADIEKAESLDDIKDILKKAVEGGLKYG